MSFTLVSFEKAGVMSGVCMPNMKSLSLTVYEATSLQYPYIRIKEKLTYPLLDKIKFHTDSVRGI